jgi:hypothetical protein
MTEWRGGVLARWKAYDMGPLLIGEECGVLLWLIELRWRTQYQHHAWCLS